MAYNDPLDQIKRFFKTSVITLMTGVSFMTKSERLNILSEIEAFAFYGLPDFDDEQRLKYFTFTKEEIV